MPLLVVNNFLAAGTLRLLEDLEFVVEIKLTLVDSSAPQEPSRDYFQAVEQAARRALRTPVLRPDQVWSICEYLDAVDSRCLAMDRPLYRNGVDELAHFLDTYRDSDTVQLLAARSWAAAGLLELLLSDYRPAPRLRAVA